MPDSKNNGVPAAAAASDNSPDAQNPPSTDRMSPNPSSTDAAHSHAQRPILIYTRPQILSLYHSPLVKPLGAMPAIKDWFGDWPEQNGKNYPETIPLSAAPRDRRFRRDQDDSDPPPRSTYRSTLSQPPPMGNFKHSSSRTNDRDRDRERDTEKERERDIRDREGQERLRNLSDKYDRDRLQSSASGGLRGKDRDSAPHLSVSSSRIAPQTASNLTSNRRGEGRESTRRKAGESNDDWRRGREEREGGRKDREDRDRPRSPKRDNSRSRRDASLTSRKERDRERDDKDRDDHRRRDRDRDREADNDDPRRWRDDGKRDERMLSRRERERERESGRDRPPRNNHESAWDTDRPRDRDRDRWNTEERESRPKRVNGRDRRTGDDDKDKDDRKDREREREKEKEPAWMETYVPSSSSGGILGGKASDGALDGIQAWKKGMKEKEEKEKAALETTDNAGNKDLVNVSSDSQETKPSAPNEAMDEIQLFRMMMKREEEKKKHSSDAAGSSPSLESPLNSLPAQDANEPGLHDMKASSSLSVVSMLSAASSHADSTAIAPTFDTPLSNTSSNSAVVIPSSLDNHAVDVPQPTGSRFFPNPAPVDVEKNVDIAINAPAQPQYNPPPGSRLLALGSRTSATPSGLPKNKGAGEQTSAFGPTLSQISEAQLPSLAYTSDATRLGPVEQIPQTHILPGSGIRAQMNYPSFENQLRPPINLDDDVYSTESMHRPPSLAGRGQYGNPGVSPFNDMGVPTAVGYPNFPPTQSPSIESSLPERSQGGSPYQSKVSRFARFFDGKTRDGPTHVNRTQGSVDYASPLPHAMQRLDLGMGDSYAANGAGINAEGRTMEDIFAMLQSSAQRGNPMAAPLMQQHGGPPSFNQSQLQAHMQTERNVPVRNMDVLYDNRLDDRNFMPDGMVPGLRSVPPPRNRDSIPLFREQDEIAFNVQTRLPQRAAEPPFVPPPQAYPGQSRNMIVQQQPYRNGVSPVPNPTTSHNLAQQRLPPGLANLGGRPPHEPSQYLNSGMGLNIGHMQGGSPGQSQYNTFAGGNGQTGFNGGPPMHGPPPPGPQQLHNGLGPAALAGLGLNKVDMRAINQVQLMGLGNVQGGAGMRVPAGNLPPPQANPAYAQQYMRQQALQQQLPPQGLRRVIPPIIQGGGAPVGQPAQDLMALLLHGAPRE